MNKLNDDLRRVIVGEYNRVPIETDKTLWFFWYYRNGEWDSESITRPEKILNLFCLIGPEAIDKIFCVWHGNHRTNLFLMDNQNLIRRLIKLQNMKGGLQWAK